jgi:UDP-2-acetamido-3-amino-2,3-dideoxy-glucuronate N-acetyltransferase
VAGSDAPWVHPTAIVEGGVTLGGGSKIWDSVHIRRGAQIGRDCIVGEKSYVAYDCVIGNFVKINANVYICAGVNIGDFCMISAHVVFTNDRYPRAGNLQLTALETSEPTGETMATRVERGVTIGANATIGPSVRLGAFAMIGMGSVVTHDVPAYRLVVGNPARAVGWVCVCGLPLAIVSDASIRPELGKPIGCERCDRRYSLESPERLIACSE